MSLEALGRWSEDLRITVVRIAPSEEVASWVAAAFHSAADPTGCLKEAFPPCTPNATCPAGCSCDLLGVLHGPAA
jgi:hypothetical protein